MTISRTTKSGNTLGVVQGGKTSLSAVSPFIQQVRAEARTQLQGRISTMQQLATAEATRLVANLQQQSQCGDTLKQEIHCRAELPQLSATDLVHRVTLRTAFTDALAQYLAQHGMRLEQVDDPSSLSHNLWFARFKG